MEDVEEFQENISVDEEPNTLQKQASNGDQAPHDAGADDTEDLAGTINNHGEGRSPSEETD
eukprot:11447686-Ditylum_brightwellii.AAC.1